MPLSALILPKKLHKHFTTIAVLEWGDISTTAPILKLHLEAKKLLASGYYRSAYKSKGFYRPKRLQYWVYRKGFIAA